MAFLLNIILIIVLCAIFAFVFTVFGIFRSIYNFKKKFNDLTSGGKSNGFGKSNGSYGNSSSYGRGSGFGSYSKTSNSDGQEIIDSRNPNEANRKIFSDNEGEYVDFEEE
ncbi:MAG: DUF4834 family protein [Prevotella sp.]|nr:DUF4834 family protein [Prevotella sp.]